MAGEEEAQQRAAACAAKKREAARENIILFEERRNASLHRKNQKIAEKAELLSQRASQRMEHDVIIEQQVRERMMMPYRMHEKDRMRLAVAPVRVDQMIAARIERLNTQRQEQEGEVDENRKQREIAHGEWVSAQYNRRNEVVKRIHLANKQRMQKAEEHSLSVRQYNEQVEKMKRRETMRETRLRLDREEFDRRNVDLNAAIYESQVGATVIDKKRLLKVIGGAREKLP